MARRVSSAWTFFYKYVFATIWIAGFGLGVAGMFAVSEPARWLFLMLWLGGSLFLWVTCVRLKYVEMWDDKLFISNLFRDARVPLSEIQDVRQNRLINTRLITIRFRNKTPFGWAITFMPPLSLRLFSEDPLVASLRAAGTRTRQP